MQGYELIDSGDFRKLERVGPYFIIRQALAAVWPARQDLPQWKTADAEFIRGREGTGEWKIRNPKLKDPFWIAIEGIQFQIKLTAFGHLGIFPEQRRHWLRLEEMAKKAAADGRKIRALNLFAYTGGATMFCARGGAEVTHVDASKGTVNWARENAARSGLEKMPVRWLVDDVKDFVARELRRESRYNMVILDPPSYGKGEKKQVWKIQQDLIPLLFDLKKLMEGQEDCSVCLSAHTEGYTPVSLTNQLKTVLGEGRIEAAEMLIPDSHGRPLPSGNGAFWTGRL